MNIAYLGPEGSYSEEAAAEKFPQDKLVPFATIDRIFQAVGDRVVDLAVVPMENIIQGPVTETQDGLYNFHKSVRIKDMMVMPIRHSLGARGDKSQIREILSKDQALKQCTRYLGRDFPQARLIEVDSTSAAVARVANNNSHEQGAIASPRAITQYGLNIIDENIGDTQRNKTRFVVLGPADTPGRLASGADATAFVIYPPGDRVGILEEILSVISRDHGLSLSSIHSRPDKRGAFRFYMELEGHIDNPQVRACLDALRQNLADDLAEICVFGSYPRCPFDEPVIRTIGIVGGTGKMGRWFQRFFEQAGYQVMINGRTTALSVEECVAQSQAVLINVPIEHSVATAKRVGRLLKPGQLVLDNTSVKREVVAALLEVVQDGVEVLGMHTIFGPGVESLRKRNVVFTRTASSSDVASEFENIFYKHGAKISYADEQTHDQQMAFHQNLEHFSKIVLAKVMSVSLQNIAEARSYSSPNSRASLRTMARVLDIDAGLLKHIQTHNTQGVDIIRRYIETASELLALIEAGDLQGIEDMVQSSRQAIGDTLLADLRSDDQ